MPSEDVGEDLRHMVNNPELSDIIFVCEDGVEVQACRLLLAARSSYFKQMLLNGMAESRSGRINMPTVMSSVLIVVLKFLYVGKLSDDDICYSSGSRGVEVSSDDKLGSCRVDWNLLVKLAVAARFFLLHSLERLVVDKLWNDTPGWLEEESLTHVASRLSALCEYPELLAEESEVKSIKGMRCSLVDTLITRDLSPAILSHMSESALRYYISETRRKDLDDKVCCEYSLHEYMRLRNIITWCAVRDGDGIYAPLKLDRACLPSPEVAVDFMERHDGRSLEQEFDFTRGRADFAERVSKGSLKELLDLVNLASIDPELICNVIEPLGIIEQVTVEEVVRAQALRGAKRLRMSLKDRPSDVWHLLLGDTLLNIPTNDSSSFTVTTRREAKYFRVTATADCPLRTNLFSEQDYIYEWEIVATPSGLVGQQTMANFSLGFIRLDRGETLLKDWDLPPNTRGNNWFQWNHRVSVLEIGQDLRSAVFHGSSTTHSWRLRDLEQFEWIKPIKVMVNKTKGTCSFSYAGNNVTFQLAWHYAFARVLYPTIRFSANSSKSSFRPYYDLLTVDIKNQWHPFASSHLKIDQ